MNFDIEKIKKIPKLTEYKGTTADEWCDFLGGPEYVKKPIIEAPKVKIQAITDYTDLEENRDITKDEVYEVTEKRAEEIVKADLAKYVA